MKKTLAAVAAATLMVVPLLGASSALAKPKAPPPSCYPNCEGVQSTAGYNAYNANMVNINAQSVNFSGANLTGAKLNKANLTGANLTGADLSGANLTKAQWKNANLTNANLLGAYGKLKKVKHATFNNTTCPDGTVTNTGC